MGNELPGDEGGGTDSGLDGASSGSSSESDGPTWRADIPNDGADPRYEHIEPDTANDEVRPTLGNVLQMEFDEEGERLSDIQIDNDLIKTFCTGKIKNGQRECKIKHDVLTYCPLQKNANPQTNTKSVNTWSQPYVRG